MSAPISTYNIDRARGLMEELIPSSNAIHRLSDSDLVDVFQAVSLAQQRVNGEALFGQHGKVALPYLGIIKPNKSKVLQLDMLDYMSNKYYKSNYHDLSDTDRQYIDRVNTSYPDETDERIVKLKGEMQDFIKNNFI